jgi:hypothetical protein
MAMSIASTYRRVKYGIQLLIPEIRVLTLEHHISLYLGQTNVLYI